MALRFGRHALHRDGLQRPSELRILHDYEVLNRRQACWAQELQPRILKCLQCRFPQLQSGGTFMEFGV
jgi:hypothetical protein